VVSIFSGKRQVALGAIVNSDGLIVTKASEVQDRKKIRCRLADGNSYSAKVFKTDEENDIALLKIAATNLPVIRWSDSQPLLGSFLITPDANGRALAIGSYSVRSRSTIEGEQPFLGVQPIVVENGVAVTEIKTTAAAFAAGLRDGDVIVELAGQPIVDVPGLVKAIRQHRPGDQVKIAYRRNGSVLSTVATLAGRGMNGERAARFKMMNRLGAVPSRRDGNFPNVFQHDTPLFPEQCGGPIVDLDGNVVGLNIARRGRAASFALPSGYVRTLVEKVLREDVAEASRR
jgi:serine protease Do